MFNGGTRTSERELEIHVVTSPRQRRHYSCTRKVPWRTVERGNTGSCTKPNLFFYDWPHFKSQVPQSSGSQTKSKTEIRESGTVLPIVVRLSDNVLSPTHVNSFDTRDGSILSEKLYTHTLTLCMFPFSSSCVTDKSIIVTSIPLFRSS